MDLAGDQVALLDQRDQGGGKGDQAGHGDPHQQVGAHKQLAVIEVGDGHATKGAEHHHGQDDAADLEVARAVLALDQGLALFRRGGAGFLGLDAKKHRIARQGEQPPHHQRMEEVEIEGEGVRHGGTRQWRRSYCPPRPPWPGGAIRGPFRTTARRRKGLTPGLKTGLQARLQAMLKTGLKAGRLQAGLNAKSGAGPWSPSPGPAHRRP